MAAPPLSRRVIVDRLHVKLWQYHHHCCCCVFSLLLKNWVNVVILSIAGLLLVTKVAEMLTLTPEHCRAQTKHWRKTSASRIFNKALLDESLQPSLKLLEYTYTSLSSDTHIHRIWVVVVHLNISFIKICVSKVILFIKTLFFDFSAFKYLFFLQLLGCNIVPQPGGGSNEPQSCLVPLIIRKRRRMPPYKHPYWCCCETAVKAAGRCSSKRAACTASHAPDLNSERWQR